MLDDIAERVLRVIAKTQRLPREAISLSSTFEELGADSYDRLNIVFALEEEFDVSVPDVKVKEIRTLSEAVTGIEALLGSKPSGPDASRT